MAEIALTCPHCGVALQLKVYGGAADPEQAHEPAKEEPELDTQPPQDYASD